MPVPKATVEQATKSLTANDREALRRWRVAQSRVGWRPMVTAERSSDSLSQFGGHGLLQANEGVPTCKLCGRNLQLFVQLDLGALPTDEFGSGLLQLFYCIGQRPDGLADGVPFCGADDAWEPFSNVASLVRVVAIDSLVVPVDTNGAVVPAASIIGWEPFDDAPDGDDYSSCGLELAYDFKGGTVTVRCPSVDLFVTVGIDEIQEDVIPSPAERDKLGGWPRWIQGKSYPACTVCGNLMRLVFQIDSDDNVPYTFGDCGIGHITQCHEHQEVVAFGWACS